MGFSSHSNKHFAFRKPNNITPKMALPKQQPSLKSSCLEVVLTQGKLSSPVPSHLPELPQTLAKELELITVTGLGPVKIDRIQWTYPQVPSLNSQVRD